jgi:1-aminocyclopropane-1-carboxylate deaminase/D-cysteine desulfhydrase-like pyridoxal-dependent ACC family enzyme
MDSIDYAKSYKPAGSPVQEVNDPILKDSGIRLLIKRDDLINENISGNKWRKLKHNISEAIQQNHHTILTFGGAYSNHISATAYTCKKVGLESIGIIRGEDDSTNPTLNFARENGMQLEFVARTEYKEMTMASLGTPLLDELKIRFGRFFLVPEGGANGLGVRGCAEILSEVEEQFDVVCCAAGTATTLAGLAISLQEDQKLIGFPALKGGGFLEGEVKRLAQEFNLSHGNLSFELETDYHFGGYAKLKPELLEFINGFTERTGIPLDPIYTGKMMFGIYDVILNSKAVGAYGLTPLPRGTTILAVHTGGLQGWQGMKHRGLV